MEYNFSKIDFPSNKEKKKSIQQILDIGVPQPKRLSIALPALWHNIGLRGLCFGVADCVFLALLASSLLWGFLFVSLTNNLHYLSVLLFLCSPFLYALLHLLTIWKEILNGTYEQLMTCRCSLRQLTTLRMLVFGAISVILTTLFNGALWTFLSTDISVLRMIGISFSSLFLFALSQLLIEWKQSAPFSTFIVSAIWMALCLLLLLLGEKSEAFLTGIPTILFYIIALFCLFCYLKTLKHYYFDAKEGALAYVIR